MEFKQIKELMTAMGRTGTRRLSIKKEGFELELEREVNGSFRMIDHGDLGDENPMRKDFELHRASIAVQKSESLGALTAQPKQEVKEEQSGSFVTSPMVGTYYSSPSPEDPAFVKVGDRIEKDTVVCIIEAMKVMNEVKAGVAGTVAEILLENGNPVEFGSKLFRVV